MSKIYAFLVIAITLVLGACASAPPLQQPLALPQTKNITIFRSPVLDQTAHTVQHLNEEKDIVYYQTYGGGGVGLGLLGPFGVAANIKMIEANTMKDVGEMKGKININVAAIFQAAAMQQEFSILQGQQPSTLKLNPYLLVEKTEGDLLMLASAVIVDAGGKYPHKYLVQLPETYSVAALAALTEEQLSELTASVAKGYQLILDRIEREYSATPLAEQKIMFKSEFLTPRFNFEMSGSLIEESDNLVWIRMIGSVAGVMPSSVTYKKVQGK